MKKPGLITLFSVLVIASCVTKKSASPYVYTIDDPSLYDTIKKLDSIFFHYYNTCDINFEQHAAFYSDSIEFYHDKGGLSTVKQDILSSLKKYVCGKVRRDLVKGSIEVYPIPGFGAIEMGLHKFFNKQEPDAIQRTGRFTIIWQQTNAGWKVRKVISLH